MKELQYINKYFSKYKWRLLIGLSITILSKFLALKIPQIIGDSLNVVEDYQKIKKSEIENLIDIFNKETNKRLVYEIHSSVDALSNYIHNPKKFINRRKIAKFEYLIFKLKNYFNNFNHL